MATPTDHKASRVPTEGAQMMKIRRPRAADPLVRPKKRPLPGRPAANPAAAKGAPALKPTTATPLGTKTATETPPTRLPRPNVRDDMTVNGFSGPQLSNIVTDYPLVTTKRALREGLKHHVAKFISKKSIDPRDEQQFTRPVRLQRRDPRAKPPDPDAVKREDEKPIPYAMRDMTEAERVEFEAKKAAREKEREENLAQIAPSTATSQKQKNLPKPKTQQVMKADMTAEEIAKARIKYEEALPWHMEDFDNKNTWMGNYEAALSETYAMFVLEPTGKMRMVPIDKWYRFSARNAFKTLTIEEAEKFMSKKIKDPRWFMEKQQEVVRQKELEAYAKQRKVYRGREVSTTGLDGDDMDFEEDRFADDEEVDAGLFEEDEDTKAAEQRIKQDQLKANVFDLKEEKDYDEEELREKKEREARKVLGKKVRKALQRREKNYDYSSGSDVNPYSDEESSDEDSEAENEKEEDKKTEDEKALAKEKEKEKESGASTKASTPSGRPKHTDALKKTSGIGRKRIGSPNLSDASGTDTSRKKPKHAPPHSVPSPSGLSQTNKKRNRVGGPGSGSDIEGGAISGADLSDAGKAKKLKLNLSRAGTPLGSRSGSPAAPLRAGTPEGGSNLKGPLRTSTPRPSVSSTSTFPTPAEIHAAIPASGITSRDLLKIFNTRIGDSKENHRRFIAIVKDVGIYGKEDRLLRPGVLRE
ncbi:transcription initiation factor IIF subunit alpha, putative [Talaromyces stipitatus ATCC 10500]|uniref:Transcription initiation factor IIF subunit alpha, putative n=1 Tax=Talaromyces stipitatus (strain ATCC 10500 / CBS 375.48 / QM 6759 / NRRL 1006) TaxID=441959 RepID=B8MNV7_TALSN|nr:transcription initiation factor IIF subunit alpha, putative [Talaromyces stipitatus ATCC 10500]EED14196.1 transcription initiation factor IIF subunit alpha, putative [Talaromyces stipitatus ATCC 10500]